MRTSTDEILLSIADIRRAAVEGAITEAEAQRLIEWACVLDADRDLNAPPPPVESSKGLNLITVAYYFGAMLMISACAWFLGDKWEVLGSSGVLATTCVYFMVAAAMGWWLRKKGYLIGGGLLITVAVCLVPLITFSIEDLAGIWPADDPGQYKDYYPLINGSWIVMELATITVAAIALWFVRFGFLTAPLAFSFWFLSMDIAALILGQRNLDWNTNAWIGVMVGLITIFIGWGLDRILQTRGEPRSQDFAFWCYFFGLLAFWGGMTALDSDSETGKFIYFFINIGLVAVSLYLRRSVFLVFGALGISMYLGHLAYEVFQDSVLFPFAIALIGLGMIVATVLGQKFLHRSGRGLP
jgi:hypothetical protein